MTDERLLVELAQKAVTQRSGIESAAALAELPLVAARILEAQSGAPIKVVMVCGAEDAEALASAYADRGRALELLTRLWHLHHSPPADEQERRVQASGVWTAVERYFEREAQP